MVIENSSNNEDAKDIDSVEKPLDSQKEETPKGDKEKAGILADLQIERKKRQEIEAKLKQIDEAESLKKGEHEKIITNLKAELETLKQQYSEKELVAGKWTAYEQKQREKFRETLGDVPNFDSMDLDTMEYWSNKINGNTKRIDVDTSLAKTKSIALVLDEEQKKKALVMFGNNFSEKEAYEAYAELIKKKKE